LDYKEINNELAHDKRSADADEINNNGSGSNTEEMIPEKQPEPKQKASASDLLSRLNKNISETPTSGRRFTTAQPEAKVMEAVAEEPAQNVPEAAEADDAVRYDEAALNGYSEPLMNTYEVSEKVYDDQAKSANRQEYKVRVANRAKNSRIPETVVPEFAPNDNTYSQEQYDNGQYAAQPDANAQYSDARYAQPDGDQQYAQPEPPQPQHAPQFKFPFGQRKKRKDADDDPWADMVEDNAQPAEAEASVPAKVKDHNEGKPEKRKSRKEKNEEELQRRIQDAEQYVREMQTGEMSIPKNENGAPVDVNNPLGKDPLGKDPNQTFDETDMNLMVAFGMEKELKDRVGEERAEKFTESIDRSGEELDDDLVNKGESKAQKEYFEFTDPEQVKPIFKRYRADYANLLWRILSCAVLLIITFFYENIEIFGGTLPPMFNSTSYPVVHVLTGLQLLVLGGALIYRRLWDGLNELLKMKPTPDSLATVLMAVSVLYHVILCFCDIYTGIRLYNFPMMVMVMLVLAHELNTLRQEMYSFNVAASKKPKYTIDRVADEDSVMEREAFADMLPESPVMFRIGKVQFVDGFYKRTAYTPQTKKSVGIILPIIGAVALIFFTAGLAITKSFYGGLQLGYLTLVIGLPMSIFVTYIYPFYSASKAAYNHGGAIVGECSLDEYDKASVISFDDVDVFPNNRVKLKTVKTFGSSRIDQVIYDAKCVFVSLGGPLASVFSMATEIDVANGGPVEVLRIAENGLEVMLGGRHLLIGKGDFIREYQYEPINSREDEGLENSGDVTVMYMVANNEVVAKYYLQYHIDPDFDYTLTQLYKAGMCVGIRTIDPNISDFMLSTRVKISKFAVKVLKYDQPFEKREKYERV